MSLPEAKAAGSLPSPPEGTLVRVQGVEKMSEVAKVTLSLEAAKAGGRTIKQLISETKLTRTQVYNTISELRKTKAVNLTEPRGKVPTYCLARFGGIWLPPMQFPTRQKGVRPGAASAADLRLVITLNGERKSLTIPEAKTMYLQARSIIEQLKEIFK